MIVEFIGAPGAGKTVLMPVVRSHFNGRDERRAFSVLEAARPFAERTFAGKAVRALTPGQLRRFLLWQVFYLASIFYRQKFSRQNPALMHSTLAFQKQRPITEADRHHVLRWFVHLTGTYEFLTAYSRPGETLIFDEGFVHRVVQLFASENEQPDLARVAAYLDMIPQPDLVIFPSASSETCEKRVFERGVWERFRVKEREATSRFIANAHQVVNFAVQYIQSKGWTVIEVDNDNREMSVSMASLKDSLEALKTDFEFTQKAPWFRESSPNHLLARHRPDVNVRATCKARYTCHEVVKRTDFGSGAAFRRFRKSSRGLQSPAEQK